MTEGREPIPPGRLKVYRVLNLVYSLLVAALFGFALTRTNQATAGEVWWLLLAGTILSAGVAVWVIYELVSKPGKL